MLKSIIVEKGLSNQTGENNCFLNSAIQVLWHLDVFRKNFKLLKEHICSSGYCLYCALQNIFEELGSSEEKVISPEMVRIALAVHFQEDKKFQLGQMDDAIECFENILKLVHDHLNGQIGENDECILDYCLTHVKFSMNFIQQNICDCLATSEPLIFSQTVQYISAQLLVKYSNWNFYYSLKKILEEEQGIAFCPAKCGKACITKRTLTNLPDVISFGIIWSSDVTAETSYINELMNSITPQIYLDHVFDMIEECGTILDLAGMVCYYEHHYLTFVMSPKSQMWLLFDDATVHMVGEHWNCVVERCCMGRYQPLLLIYQNSNAKLITPPLRSTIISMNEYNNNSEDIICAINDVNLGNNINNFNNIIQDIKNIKVNIKCNNGDDSNDDSSYNNNDINNNKDKLVDKDNKTKLFIHSHVACQTDDLLNYYNDSSNSNLMTTINRLPRTTTNTINNNPNYNSTAVSIDVKFMQQLRHLELQQTLLQQRLEHHLRRQQEQHRIEKLQQYKYSINNDSSNVRSTSVNNYKIMVDTQLQYSNTPINNYLNTYRNDSIANKSISSTRSSTPLPNKFQSNKIKNHNDNAKHKGKVFDHAPQLEDKYFNEIQADSIDSKFSRVTTRWNIKMMDSRTMNNNAGINFDNHTSMNVNAKLTDSLSDKFGNPINKCYNNPLTFDHSLNSNKLMYRHPSSSSNYTLSNNNISFLQNTLTNLNDPSLFDDYCKQSAGHLANIINDETYPPRLNLEKKINEKTLDDSVKSKQEISERDITNDFECNSAPVIKKKKVPTARYLENKTNCALFEEWRLRNPSSKPLISILNHNILNCQNHLIDPLETLAQNLQNKQDNYIDKGLAVDKENIYSYVKKEEFIPAESIIDVNTQPVHLGINHASNNGTNNFNKSKDLIFDNHQTAIWDQNDYNNESMTTKYKDGNSKVIDLFQSTSNTNFSNNNIATDTDYSCLCERQKYGMKSKNYAYHMDKLSTTYQPPCNNYTAIGLDIHSNHTNQNYEEIRYIHSKKKKVPTATLR